MMYLSSLTIGILILSGISTSYASQKSELYDLQEKCGRRAEELYMNEFTVNPLSDQGDQDNQGNHGEFGLFSYVNHYNAKLNRCYMLVSSQSNLDENTGSNLAIQLIDVNEHNAIAFYSAGSNNKEPTECFLRDRECHSLEEWKKLIKPFIEE